MAHFALLAADLFEDVELWYPYYRVQEAGHTVSVVGCRAGIEHRGKRGTSITTDVAASEVSPDAVDAVIIPGGYSPDHMRRCRPMIDLVAAAAGGGKPVAAICHGPWMLASAGVIEGRRVTSFHSIRDDVEHAGATWVDEPIVQDGNIVTSRRPDDLPVFMGALLGMIDASPEP
jgi:protease I